MGISEPKKDQETELYIGKAWRHEAFQSFLGNKANNEFLKIH